MVRWFFELVSQTTSHSQKHRSHILTNQHFHSETYSSNDIEIMNFESFMKDLLLERGQCFNDRIDIVSDNANGHQSMMSSSSSHSMNYDPCSPGSTTSTQKLRISPRSRPISPPNLPVSGTPRITSSPWERLQREASLQTLSPSVPYRKQAWDKFSMNEIPQFMQRASRKLLE